MASQTATELDGTFPNRLVRKLRQGENDSFEDLNTALSELDDRRSHHLGCSKSLAIQTSCAFTKASSATSAARSSSTLMIVTKKLAPYDAIASKLELFKGIVNKRFKHKMLEVDRNSGFVFRSTIKTK